jgi:hypothetical protein
VPVRPGRRPGGQGCPCLLGRSWPICSLRGGLPVNAPNAATQCSCLSSRRYCNPRVFVKICFEGMFSNCFRGITEADKSHRMHCAFLPCCLVYSCCSVLSLVFAGKLTPTSMCAVVAALQPPGCVVVDESLTSGSSYWDFSQVSTSCLEGACDQKEGQQCVSSRTKATRSGQFI